MWSGMDAFGDVVPPPGLLAGMALFACGTGNTEARSGVDPGEAPACRRLIDTPSTSNTARVLRVAEIAHTSAGPVVPEAACAGAPRVFRAREAIFELRRLTGLTWEDLAELLSATRRSLHLWANGQPINTPNEKRLRNLVTAMRSLDRGTARENRSLLISPRPEGGIFSDLLREGRFDEALARAGREKGRSFPAGEDRKEARPAVGRVSLADTLGTRADRLHTDDGVVLRRRRPRRV